MTFRLFALPELEKRCEDYGQVVIYCGGIEGAESLFWLDDHHAFERGRPERVCGNTASMLADTRFSRFFEIVGDRSIHFGEYPCGPTMAAAERETTESSTPSGVSCC